MCENDIFYEGAKCELLELGMRQMQAAISPWTPGSPGSDLNPVIRTDCMLCKVC